MGTKNWQGNNDNWTANPSDWNPTGQPGSGDDVTVASGDPQISSNVGTINSLTDSATVDLVSGAVLDVATTLSNTGNLYVASDVYTGGATLTVGGTLTNSGTFDLGNGGNTSAPVMVNVGALTNTVGVATGTINLSGNSGSTPEAVTLVVGATAGFGTGTTLTGNINLASNASIQFASGSISAIAGQSELTLNGANTSILDAGGTSNSALAGLGSVIGSLTLENGNVLTTTGALSNTGTIGVDANYYSGGSSLTIGGALTNASATAAGTLNVGNGGMSTATTVTIDGGLTNFVQTETGTINVNGNTSTLADLLIHSAAGFGSAGTEIGAVNLANDAEIQFTGGGTINTINGTVVLNGADAVISSDGTATNSALAGLTTIGPAGALTIENGNSVTTTGSLTNKNFLGIDNNAYTGGSSLTLGTAGKLTNSGTINVGNGELSAATTVSVGTGGITDYAGSTTGTINVSGSTNALAALDVNAAAGFGASGVLIGNVNLYQDAQIQFKSGSITTINNGSELTLNGAGASVLDAGGAANSALSGLATVAGSLTIENGPTVSTSAVAGLTDTNFIGVDSNYYTGGSTLDVTDTLANSGTLTIGNAGLGSATTVNVGGLTNVIGSTDGTINVSGGPTSQQTGLANEGLLNVGAAAGFGTAGELIGNVNLYQDGQIQFTGGQIATITSGSELTLNGDMASIGDNGGANNALTGLATVAGQLTILNGGANNIVTTGGNLANSGTIGIDSNGSTGGSTLTVGNGTGTLTNTGTVNLGNGNLSNATTVNVGAVDNTSGTLNVDGSAINPSTGLANEGLLQVSGAAGFGSTGAVVGSVNLYDDGQIQFGSGQITTITSGSELTLNGSMAAIANDGSDTNSALTGLATVAGNLTLYNGAEVATGTATGTVSTLTVGNTLTDSGSINTPNLDIAAGGTFDIATTGSVTSPITFAGAASGTATLALDAAPPYSGSTFGNALADFGNDDALDLKGLTFAAGATATYANGTLTVTSNGVSENFTLTTPGATTFYAHQDSGSGTLITDSPICFAEGTAIRTARGDVAIDALAVGDIAITAAGQARPIRWIGRRSLDCTAHQDPAMVWPVRVAAGAFGGGRPYRDLLLSPHHAVAVGSIDEVLVPIRLLTNGTTIAQLDDVDEVTYWHVELDSHDVILANGLPAESYIDVGNRCEFEGETSLTLHPLFKSEPLAGYCRPFVTGGAVLAAIRAQLAEVAGTTPEAAAASFHLLVAGERIAPVVCGHQAAFVVPPGEHDVRLVSPTWSPCDADPASTDDRRLGLMIETLSVDDLVGGITEVPLQSRALVAGFHPLESGPLGTWRWTGGDALLSASLFAGRAGPCVLRLTGQFTPPTATPRAEALAA